jgi:hypothetical protein
MTVPYSYTSFPSIIKLFITEICNKNIDSVKHLNWAMSQDIQKFRKLKTRTFDIHSTNTKIRQTVYNNVTRFRLKSDTGLLMSLTWCHLSIQSVQKVKKHAMHWASFKPWSGSTITGWLHLGHHFTSPIVSSDFYKYNSHVYH